MKMPAKSIQLKDYEYELPESKIAKHPLNNRSNSKLLAYKQGNISHQEFKSIDEFVNTGSTLFFNNTKVIPARLHFKKDTGALIEIFLLEPISPTNEVAQAMLVKGSCEWHCMIGNFKKWKEGQILSNSLILDGVEVTLKAEISNRERQVIKFHWEADLPFVDIVSAAGKIPLPPYINRELNDDDKERYQTIYSKQDGAVAAPTAGLHFTEEVMNKLKSGGNTIDYLTLHVSAGTFQPIKVENALEHVMHSEQVVVSMHNIDTLLNSENVIAVGTTSMRTLESLYWYGVKLIKTQDHQFSIEKLAPYQFAASELPSGAEAILAIKAHMEKHQLNTITGFTEIFIFPGYDFKICKGLITNFHLPGSTLILLVAAFIGEDWRKVYEEALENDYRFLSYGDSSILLPH